MILKFLREKQPLIHCITNPISINQCANLILALSCRPIMAEHPDEVSEITSTSDALLLNLGNITDARMKSIIRSAKEAAVRHIPSVFDAVGVACSTLRRSFTAEFLESYTPTVLKGNYSEIKAVYDEEYVGCGVDADTSLPVTEITRIAAELSRRQNCIVLASGKCDIVTDGKKVIYIKNGCPRLGALTGTGCMLGATVACALASSADIYSVARACALFSICGELADGFPGLGSFAVRLMDSLSLITDEDIENYIRTEEKDIEKL